MNIPVFRTSVFSASANKVAIPREPQCNSCGLYRTCKSPKQAVSGNGKRKILIVGQGPGYHEDQQGRAFVGPSGELLRDSLRRFGVEMREDCWITNAVICRPSDKGKNRPPFDKEVDYCRPNLIKAINTLQPEVIIPLGSEAVRSLLGWIWREAPGSIDTWEGFQIPSQKLNAWIAPIGHPAALLHGDNKENDEDEAPRANSVRKLIFNRYLSAACKLQGRPWKKVPDYASKVEIIVDDREAAKRIEQITEDALSHNEPIAFDYETTTLKPDGPLSEIVCCSVSSGRITVAYPWGKLASAATKAMLLSPVRKIASNMKMEQRWSLAKLGIWVEGWWVDTMEGAHILDNRQGITSIKFQGFVLLGQDAWNLDIEPYLKSANANTPNRIYEYIQKRGWPAVLRYNGMDSLIEWLVARRQAPGLGVEPIIYSGNY